MPRIITEQKNFLQAVKNREDNYFFAINPLRIFLIVPNEFLAIKPTIEAMTIFEGKSTLSAIAPVLSIISLALLSPLLMVRISITKAMAIIIKITDQMTTKTIKATSSTDIGLSIHYKDKARFLLNALYINGPFYLRCLAEF